MLLVALLHNEHGAHGHAVRAVVSVDGATTVDGDGSGPPAKRMSRARRDESCSERDRASSIARSLRPERLNMRLFSRCSDLP
jgi:hypothetical protein